MNQSDIERNPSREPIAVTMGDPAGIGLQTTIEAWMRRHDLDLPAFAVFADTDALKAHAAGIGADIPLAAVDNPGEARAVFAKKLPVIEVPLEAPLRLGNSEPNHAPATIASIEFAVKSVLSGAASAVVTNPITKATLTAAGFRHPGHTEFLGALAERLAPDHNRREPVMLLAADDLRVVPLTIHIPLCRVASTLTTDFINQTLITLSDALKRDFAVSKPRIAVAGLNPHAGEGATIGSEDRDVILPAIVHCRDLGIDVQGPLPADTMFHASARTRYDAALCMYHDQALIPVKTLAFDRGVNVTLGLPFVRTSPDHGTALDIVGSRSVSAISFIESLKLAKTIANNRAEFDGDDTTGKSAPQVQTSP